MEVSEKRIDTIEKTLRSACWIIKRKGREILSDFDITPPQFNALNYLVFEGEMTIGELSSKMYLACSTVTDLLDRMERNELVKRVKDEKDRRVIRLKVLDKGNKIIEEVLENRRKYLKTIFNDLDENTMEMIFNSLNIIEECMENHCKEEECKSE